MNLSTNQLSSLFDLLFTVDPAFWACPVQNGIPFFIALAGNLLYLAAGAVFLYGVVMASLAYLTAFGDENKAKKGRETLQWTFIGAVVIMLIVPIINTVTGLFIESGQNLDLGQVALSSNCQSLDLSTQPVPKTEPKLIK